MCRICREDIEDVKHFVLDCPAYERERKLIKKDLKKKKINFGIGILGESKLIDNYPSISRYLKRITKKRNKLLGIEDKRGYHFRKI